MKKEEIFMAGVFQVAQYGVLIVKYAKDQRYDESGIATHCGQVRFES